MEKTIRGKKYDIIIGTDLSEKIKGVIDAPETFLVTDSNVEKLYGGRFKAARFVLPAGEESKKLSTVGAVCEAMLEAGCNRKTTVIALGGGVVGDIAGFAASVYMRGVKVIQVPTTLLAMCDSSIGGKTGVDICGKNSKNVKNIIGAFHQPSAVLCSLQFLKTLPQRELLCGLGEIFKTALLDAGVYNEFRAMMKGVTLDKNGLKIQWERLDGIITMCAAFKLDVAERDEKETSLRKILNVGHTLGHALEAYDKCRLAHGEYVVHGVGLEADIARDIGLINAAHYREIKEYCALLTRGEKLNFDVEKLAALCACDKKNQKGGVSVMLSLSAGKTEEVMLKQEELIKALQRIKSSK